MPHSDKQIMPTIATLAAMIAMGWLLLLVPAPAPAPPEPAGGRAFTWDADGRWETLAARFDDSRARGCTDDEGPPQGSIQEQLDGFAGALDAVEQLRPPPAHRSLVDLEAEMFVLGARIAACRQGAETFVALVSRLRAVVKGLSTHWDLADRGARNRLYRLLYGGRATVEEVLLQGAADEVPALVMGTAEPSATPSVDLRGVTLHSGDILLSRGGAPTSALIARGNDYPGNFSHVSLLYVDAETNTPHVIESHIAGGVVVASADAYLRDTKLRIAVLRLRSDLPAVTADPMLPHRAAEAAYRDATERHIPYDFEMDYLDPKRQFCSEVASSAYAGVGVQLWQSLTSISTRGTARWLASFGVTHFETHGPSDLEYDPQVRVVAEWRDQAVLYQDHLDNAAIDALLEGAEAGDEIGHDAMRLPLARLAKAYSGLLEAFGGVGPIPEGMSATAALTAESLRARHRALVERLAASATAYERAQGHRPPYWELVRMAREAR